jgi:hypothetical protein
MLYSFQYSCTILFGLVPDYGSATIRRSSQSLHGFGVSLPVALSHTTFVRYKASYLTVHSKLSSVSRPTVMEIGPHSRSLFITMTPKRGGIRQLKNYYSKVGL